MSRSADAAHREVLSLLPPGWIWPGRDSVLAAVLRPIADEVADIEATAEAMMEEIDPRTAVLCLEDFERVLGPDPCGRDVSSMDVPARQRLAHQRWTARGGQSIAYFVGLAAKRGVTITIEEVHVSQVGVLRAGDELVNSPEQYVWRVILSLGAWDVFRAGESVAGDRLYDFELSDIECDIRRAKPAHTEVVFSYLDANATSPVTVTVHGDPLRLLGSLLVLPA
ncbi:YmfQ family protein [Azorhizobium doebereinerae]|uniref:YmfQ family protein n=1 Tax=Azorhizobium doebereinerae TaxID=281091 RepID=UPI00040C362B|nr:putative phage tail protein [Azorhizobium doebereinerae]